MQNIFKPKFYNSLTCSLKSGNAFLTQPHSGYGLFSEWVLTQTVDIRYRWCAKPIRKRGNWAL